MILKTLFFCSFVFVAHSKSCYDTKCKNYDGSYISCDQSRYSCTEGSYFAQNAICIYTGTGDPLGWRYCFDSEICLNDIITGEASCNSNFIEAGLNLVMIIIIAVVVIIVIVIITCCVCCYCLGKGCFGNRRQQGRVVNAGTSGTGQIAYHQPSGNVTHVQHNYPPGQYPPGQYPPAQYPPAQYPPAQYPPTQYPPSQYPSSHPPGQYPPAGGYSHYPGQATYSPEENQGAYPSAPPPPPYGTK